MGEPTIAVIGAGGFVGRELSRILLEQNPRGVRLFNRSPGDVAGCSFEPMPRAPADLAGVDAVVHLAGLAHQSASAPSYQDTNVQLPLDMAALARGAGVSRFVFASSLAVFGRWREGAMGPDTETVPTTPYGQSKVEAERCLADLLQDGPVQLKIIRPPLVYGPAAKANFNALVRAARMGVPLPLGMSKARRSMVSLANLTDAITHLCRHDRSDGAPVVLLPADGRDLMVPEIYASLCRLAGKPTWQPPIPPWAMQGAMRVMGRAETFDSLFRPAIIDRSHWAGVGWSPPQSVEDGLREAVLGTGRDGC